jgi:glycosyltransferase involved in cell wall biosynthesis
VRVLQLIPVLSVGGAEVVVLLLARALSRLGHEVTVVALGPSSGSWIERALREEGVALRFLDKGPGLDPRCVPRLRRTLRELRPDVVHTHLHVLKYLLPARPRCPVVHTLHNLAQHEATRSDQALQQLAFRLPGVRAVAIGRGVAESFRELYGLEPAANIPNGIEVLQQRSPAGTGEEARRELGVGLAAPVFVTVGRLHAQKNHRLLLSAWADARLERLGATLLVVGDGDLRAELEEQAGPLGARVRFLGIRRDVPRLLAASDAFVLSSDYEGNPLVVMEAMAARRPVVATSVGCVPELIEPGTGRLVPAGDLPALTRALVELASDRPLCAELGVAAGDLALRRFDAAVMAASYERVYTTLGERRGGS